MMRLGKEEIDPNTQYVLFLLIYSSIQQHNDEEYYEEDNGDGMDEEDGGETALIGQNQESDGAGYTPGNAAAGFDKVQINNNFQYGGVNRLIPQQQLGHGKIRPQSAKTGDDQQLKFQQQYNQAWVDPQQQYSYQVNSNNSMGQPPPMIGAFNAGQPYANNGFYPGIQQVGNYIQKKRPTTASRRNNVQFGAVNKKQFGSKNPSTIDLEISRLRPRIVHQEREKLFDDAMKQKMQANYLKDENIKLKTKIQQLENELTKKERLVDDLLQQESFQGQAPQKMNKMKLEGHLSMNLKRKIREMQMGLQARQDEVEALKRNIKSTKIAEIEVESKMYMDECIRLRHQLEEVIKSKDTFADPEELKIIEEKFQNQDLMINNLRNENSELAKAYQMKDQESQQLREYIQQQEQKQKKAATAGKEKLKLKKLLKEKEKENQKMKIELQNQKVQNEDYRVKIEELVKKNQSNFNSRPQTASYYQGPSNNVSSSAANSQLESEVKRLRSEIADKDLKIQGHNTVVQQLQSKLQEKINELTRETSEKNKFKELSEKYLNQIAQLEAQIEDGSPNMKQAAKKILNQSKEERPQQPQRQQTHKSNEGGSKPSKTMQSVDPKQLGDLFLELKLKLQAKAFYSNQIKDFFFKPYQSDGEVTVKQMKEILEVHGIDEKRSLLAARYLIEPKKKGEISFSEDNSATQKDIIAELQNFIGHYNVFNDANKVKKLNENIQKIFAKCKGTLKDALQVEDYEEDGTIPIYAFKDVFETLDLEVDEDLMEYIIYAIYQKSESIDKMKYQVLLDLIDGKIINGQLSVGSEGQGRKRPESSSPEKLKARNKDKYTNNSQPTEQDKKKTEKGDEDEEDDGDNYEDEFEKLLDKDDEEDATGKSKKQQENGQKQGKQSQEGEDEEDMEGEEEDYINEEEMLDIAEKCFVKIAESILEKGISVRQAFCKFIIQQDLEGEILELLSPIGFLEGIKDLGIVDLEEVEVACLMRVLTKAELEHAILLRELIVIMENFGIQDDEGPTGANLGTENYDQDDMDNEQLPSQPDEGKPKKGKKKKGTQKPMDLSQLDEKSVRILAKMILALMELNATLDEFFDGVIYEQLVKTKTKSNTVEIINSKDFFDILQQRGVRKSNKEHENLKKFLQLDPNYPNLIMLKKVAKCLDELAKNEELMAGILQGYEDDEGINAAEGQIEGEGGQQRLITIGEDGEEGNYDTHKQDSKGTAAHGQKKLSAIQQQDAEEEDNEYDQNDYEENDDDYAF